jgi:tetratricopeptide (TPR) repeat protein
MLERAERNGSYDYRGVNLVYQSTARTWIRIGRLDRALAGSRKANARSSTAAIQHAIARALIVAGKNQEALAVLDEALVNGRQITLSPFGFFLSHLNLRLDAGDRDGARQLADEILARARKRNVVRLSNLELAAMAYNDIGDRQRAAEILIEAIAEVPPPDRRIGTSLTLGPIFGSTLGLNESMRSTIAVALYRAGKREEFEAQLRKLSAWYQARTWVDLHRSARRRGESEPSDLEVLKHVEDKPGFFNALAIQALHAGDAVNAAKLLRQAIVEAESDSQVRSLVMTAKIAFAGGFLDIATESLRIAARMALRIDEPAERAVELANIAALQHELLDN